MLVPRIGSLVWAVALWTNAIAILNEERFLSRIGWGRAYEGYAQQGSVKKQIITLIGAVRTLMRIPLIAINILIILYEIFLG